MSIPNVPLQEAIDNMVLLVAKMSREQKEYEDALVLIHETSNDEDSRTIAAGALEKKPDLPPFIEKRLIP